jgi:thiol-disulfide isomerase/thioredoxin
VNLLDRFVVVLLACIIGNSVAAPTLPPHLAPADQSEYRAYQEAPDHRAFVVAPGGAWGWTSSESSADAAERKALADCQAQTEQHCVTFALDERTVFDAQGWSRLWRPYATAAAARNASIGNARGQRLADLDFVDAQRKHRDLSSLKGKVVVLHFWGTWCAPCRQELPELQKLHAALGDRSDVTFVLLQAREQFSVSRAWAAKQGISLPMYDSGASGEEDAEFRLAGGGRIPDRRIASRFPTTYVLDKRGLVVFSHVGPVEDWRQYEAFIRDAANHSGR